MTDLIGKDLGAYRVVEQIGSGGMATVYKAYHAAMDRYVAVKVLPEQLSRDAELRKRFQREAQVVAKLEHLHILPVYDYGEAGGRLYLVMRYIEAGTLKEYMGGQRLSLAQAGRILHQVGSALDHAHRLGVVHRDVKPNNVLVDAHGDCYLADFGLARIMEASLKLTATGVGMGTPAYMSPEQGQGVKIDARSDIYSLGVMLYEMVTGQVPYQAETPLAVVLQHISAPLPLPSKVNPQIDPQVERVILKALAKNPDDRFQKAGELIAAFERAVRASAAEGDVDMAERPEEMPTMVPAAAAVSQTGGAVRANKKPWLWVAALGGLASCFMMSLCLILALTRFRVQIVDGQLKLFAATTATPSATATLYAAAFETATPAAMPTHSPTHSALQTQATATHTSAAPAKTPTPDATSTPAPPPTETPTPLPTVSYTPLALLKVLNKGGRQAAFSPDGKMLAVAGHELILFDTQTWQPLRTLGSSGADGVAFSPDGKTLAVVMGEIKLFDPATGGERLTLPGVRISTSAASGYFLAFSPDGQTLAVIVDEVVKFFDTTSGDELGLILAEGPFAIGLSPDGQTMVAAGWSSGLKLWDVDSGQEIRTLGDMMLGANRVIWSPDGATLAFAGVHGGEIQLWNAADGRLVQTLSGHKDSVNGFAFSPDGRLLATASRDVTVRVWDWAGGRELQTLIGHSESVDGVAFSPDGSLLVSTTWNETRLWGISTEGVATPAPTRAAGPAPTPIPLADSAISPENAAQLKQTMILNQGGYQAGFSPDGKLLAVSGHSLILYDTQTWQPARTLIKNGGGGFVFAPDGKMMAVIMSEIKLFDVTTGSERLTIPGVRISTSAASSFFLAFSPDGQMLAVVVDEVVKFFDTVSGEELGLILAQGPFAISLSPDGQTLATTGWSSNLILWDVASRQEIRSMGEQMMGADRVVWSPDGTTLAVSGVHGGDVQLWNAADGRLALTLSGHKDAVGWLAFSPDGRLLATVSRDVTLRVWDLATGSELKTLLGHSQQAQSVAFSPDGAWLVSTSWDGTTRLWSVGQ